MPIGVFLVEDQQQMHSVVAELLAGAGDFQVVGQAATEAEALNWLDHPPRHWRLAIVDLVLDQGSGLNVIARARARGGDKAKVAVLSSFVSPGIRSHCLKLGADAAFRKGEDLEAFMRFCGDLAAGAPSPAA